ncbi:uncharacterized protein HD556DRAFT_1330777 [Suillus plorans]|uniref:Uncharacterized protein n=1 Tax=Suillus plorans TaxID=116603 RepID=A0A9P7DV14_9AGAM|nr:uncharacterized protein HD556DRAFT_1330777 [Suillus plorans]KAG1803877.1 hypothetical protein HD556DRAFT_1330777 [Suillus plorans]
MPLLASFIRFSFYPHVDFVAPRTPQTVLLYHHPARVPPQLNPRSNSGCQTVIGHCVCPYVAAGLCIGILVVTMISFIFCHPGRFCVTACVAVNSQALCIKCITGDASVGPRIDAVRSCTDVVGGRIEAILPVTASLKTPPQNRSRHLANQKRSCTWTGYRQVGWKHL